MGFLPPICYHFSVLKIPSPSQAEKWIPAERTNCSWGQQGDKPNLRAAKTPCHHGSDSFQGFVPDKGIELGRDSVANEPRSLPKLQPNQLLVLQLADDAIVDGQPVNVGNEQLAGQEAALVDQGIIGLCDVIFLTTCVGNKGKNPVTFTFLPESAKELRAASSSTANSAWKTITLAAVLALSQRARPPRSHVPPHCCRNYCPGEPATLTAQPELGQEPEEQGHAVLGVRGCCVHREAAGLQQPPDADDHHELPEHAEGRAVAQEAVPRAHWGALWGDSGVGGGHTSLGGGSHHP